MAKWKQDGGPGTLGNNLLAIKQLGGKELWDDSYPTSVKHLGSEKLAFFYTPLAGLTAGIKNLITQFFRTNNPVQSIHELIEKSYIPTASTAKKQGYKNRLAKIVEIGVHDAVGIADFSAIIDGIAIHENAIRGGQGESIQDYYGPTYDTDKQVALDAAIAWHTRPGAKLFTKAAKDKIKQLARLADRPELPPSPNLQGGLEYFPGQAQGTVASPPPVTTPQRPPGLPSFEAARQTGQNNPFKLKGIGETGEEELIDFGDIYDGAKQFVNEILALVRKNETISGIVKAWHRLNN